MKDLNKKILFVGGKGGVGKSTSASAIAWTLAQKKERTLLVSTDPAHNLSHIFLQQIGSDITKVTNYLSALEIDPEVETDQYIKDVKDNISGIVQASMREEVDRQLDTARASPGADEAALFDKLISIILEESSEFDKLIFDTAPTGHTIRLLSLPELMGVWIEGLLKKRKQTNENYSRLLHDGEPVEDPIYDVLKQRQQRFEKARQILLNRQETSFVFVLNPERLPILETKKAIELLSTYDLHVSTVIINKVLPEDVGGEFFRQRQRHEQTYLKMIDDTFKDQQLIYVPLFPHDISSKDELETFSQYFSKE